MRSSKKDDAAKPKKITAGRRRTAKVTGTEVASTEFAREINRDAILELIRLRQPIARVDLAHASGLQNSTVSSIVEQLLAEGWIREGEALHTARGRRPTQISLNDRMAMLVADVHPGRAVLAGVDLNGVFFDELEVTLSDDVRLSVEELARSFRELRKRHADRVFMGAGVCLPGRVDSETGRLMMAPNLHWHEYDIRAELSRRLRIPVELENDANACLLSELWFGHLEGVQDAVLLAISEGVGASLLADGHLIAGRRGLAGEFGHICYDPKGPICSCGRRGCWELYASCTAALMNYRKLVGGKSTISYARLCQLSEAGDSAALDAIERQARAIGRGLRMVMAALSPAMLLFAGEISLSWSLLLPILEQECAASLLAGKPPRFTCTHDRDRAHLLGAAAVILQRHPGYYLTRSSVRASNGQRGY